MTDLESQLLRAFNLIGRLEGSLEIIEKRIRALEGCGTVIDQTSEPAPHEAHGNVVCLPGVMLPHTVEIEPTTELEAMAKRAWRDRGIVILWPERIINENERQRIMDLARSLYGRRKGGQP